MILTCVLKTQSHVEEVSHRHNCDNPVPRQRQDIGVVPNGRFRYTEYGYRGLEELKKANERIAELEKQIEELKKKLEENGKNS